MIELDDATNDLWREVSPEGELRYCLNCATCVAGCPAAEANPPLLVRNLVRMVLLGLEDDLLDEDTPWMCVTCSRCEELCPMGVDPFEVNLAIRRWQCRNDETRIPPSVVEIYHTGYTQAVSKVTELRRSVGLTDPPPTITDLPELHARFQKMLMRIEILEENDYMFGG